MLVLLINCGLRTWLDFILPFSSFYLSQFLGFFLLSYMLLNYSSYTSFISLLLVLKLTPVFLFFQQFPLSVNMDTSQKRINLSVLLANNTSISECFNSNPWSLYAILDVYCYSIFKPITKIRSLFLFYSPCLFQDEKQCLQFLK